jgi:tetratricopeptide (TPR) repeat protein
MISFKVCHAQSNKAVDYYNKGVEFNKTGKLVKASIHFTEAVSMYPGYAQAYYQRSLSFNGMGQTQSARKDLMKAIQLGIKNVNPYLSQIKYYKSTKQYTSAILITKKLIRAMPENSAGAYYDQGLIYEEINHPKEAIAAFNTSIELLDSNSQDFKEILLNKIKNNKEKIQ